jgi:uncharacterized membrane protein YdjX (TVP38/TMEM64 family)
VRDYDSLNLRRLVPIAAIAIPIAIVAIVLANVQNLPFAREAMVWMRGIGGEWWAIPLFVLLYFACALLLLPVGLLSAAAALAWGWEVGGLFDLIACTLAALPPFHIAKRGLPRRVAAYLEKHGMTFTTTPGFFPLLLLRIVPIVPYVALNYIAGLARFRLRDYVVATFVGSIPSAFLFAFFIDTLGDSATGAATQLRILGACAAVAALAIIGRWGARFAARIVRRPDGGDPRSASPEPPPE